jgi:HAD superfamily hydrolase (TIGR01490 family)
MGNVAAFFDLDDTLINTNSAVKLGVYLIKHRQISIFKFLYMVVLGSLYLLYLLPPGKMLEIHARLLKKESYLEYEKISDELFKNPETFFNQKVLEKYIEHRKKGHKVFIITQTYHLLAHYFADILKPDELIATSLEIKNKKFTGNVQAIVSHDKHLEIQRLKRKYELDLSNSYAYTDSLHDISMLREVGNPYIVTRNVVLRSIAKFKGWNVIGR